MGSALCVAATAQELPDLKLALSESSPEVLANQVQSWLAVVEARSEPAPSKGATLDSLAVILLEGEQATLAKPLCLRALAYLSEGEPSLALANAHANHAWAEFSLNDMEAALRAQNISVSVFDQVVSGYNSDFEAASYTQGYFAYTLGQYPLADQAWSRGLGLLRQAPEADVQSEITYLTNIAEAQRLDGRFDATESTLLEAIGVSEANLPADFSRAVLLNNIGVLYWNQNRFDDAERSFKEALRLTEADPEAPPTRVATAYLNLGVLFKSQASYKDAEPLLQRAAELARATYPQDDPDYVMFLLEPGKLLADTHRFDEANKLWEEALSVLSKLETPHAIQEAQVKHDAARGYLEVGNMNRARELARDALDMRSQVFDDMHPDRGRTLGLLGKIALLDNPPKLDEAKDHLEEAIEILEASNYAQDDLAEAHAQRARVARAGGDLKKARAHLESALSLVEVLRPQLGGSDLTRAEFLTRFVGYYSDMIDLLLREGSVSEAMAFVERSRARVLQDQLAASGLDLREGIEPKVLQPLEKAEMDAEFRVNEIQRAMTERRRHWSGEDLKELRLMERDLEVALGDLKRATEEIKLQSPGWQKLLKDKRRSLSLQEVQRQLIGSDEMALLYHIGPDRSFLFTLHATGDPQAHPLKIPATWADRLGIEPGPLTEPLLTELLLGDLHFGEGESLVGTMAKLRGVSGIADAGQGRVLLKGSVEERLQALLRILVPNSVWETLVDRREVLVIPDGALHLLPFEALLLEKQDSKKVYWLDVGPVVRYGHSLTTLLEIAEQKAESKSQNIVSISDPLFGGGKDGEEVARGGLTRQPQEWFQLPRLPATAEESRALVAAFGEDNVSVFSELAATETQFKAHVQDARILHLATHGIVDAERNDLMAALVFTPPSPLAQTADDGFLFLYEIYRLPLNCDLAVLSACETKLGRRIQGEGVFALSRGFLAAGARRTIASLWPVSDNSTAALMGGFFERIAEESEHRSYAEALRDAKREVRNDPRWQSPFYWAPFVATGLR
ncbi:MAG: CHAT domain-containing protein [Candidatus Eisenbacteria bacterium]|uniref:CHAT domain-containing protein n=1 Tax=Eiseniibacteriota bacterium TaxID=2212470 RepID=A0A7Y2H2A7_UNCEI|nr:CHAT domain-containing protein [Candidatus Eisenbacteria bacterium]